MLIKIGVNIVKLRGAIRYNGDRTHKIVTCIYDDTKVMIRHSRILIKANASFNVRNNAIYIRNAYITNINKDDIEPIRYFFE